MTSILKSPLDMLKEHAVSAGVAAGFDLFVADPLCARLQPMLQGPAKIIGYPILGALIEKFLPSMGKVARGMAMFGMAFGVKDTLSRLLSTPQAAIKDLADAYGGNLGALVSNQSGGMGALVSNTGVQGMDGFGDGVTNADDYVMVD